jgi:hypothetical protein
MVGDINSESWAVSFRNVGRLQIGMVGEIARNLHQVFVSSTYSDLQDERKHLSETLAKVGYIPQPAWSYSQRAIRNSWNSSSA